LEVKYDEPLFFVYPYTKAAAPVAFPSPHTTREYPTVEELSIEMKPTDTHMLARALARLQDSNNANDWHTYNLRAQRFYNARAERVPERLRDLFRLVHEVRPKHATFKLRERADTFTAPSDADQVQRELDLLLRESRVRDDMAEYGMEVRLPMAYRRFNGMQCSAKYMAAWPAKHELTVEMDIGRWTQ